MDVFTTLCDIVEKYRNAEEIWINISSTTTLPAFAAAALYSLYKNVHIFYVCRGKKVVRKPEEDYDPILIDDQGPKKNALIKIYLPRGAPLSEEEKQVLISLYELGDGEHEQSALFRKLSEVLDWKPDKVHKMRLGRMVDSLEEEEFIEVRKKGKVNLLSLTSLGKAYAAALKKSKLKERFK